VLSLFDRARVVLGLPTLYVFIFAVWVALIAAIAWIVERGIG
jgi:hypothetical protein